MKKILFYLALFIIIIVWTIIAYMISLTFLEIISITISIVAIWIAFISDERIKSIATSNFIEKRAMLEQYIFSLERDEIFNYKRLIADLEASLTLKDYCKKEEIKKFINALRRFIEEFEEKSKQASEEKMKNLNLKK